MPIRKSTFLFITKSYQIAISSFLSIKLYSIWGCIKKELVIDFKFYGEPKEALKKVESSVKNTMFGDRVSLPSRDYEQLKKLALSTVGAKHVLDRVRKTSDKKIERLETR